jgi:hypothetical protein
LPFSSTVSCSGHPGSYLQLDWGGLFNGKVRDLSWIVPSVFLTIDIELTVNAKLAISQEPVPSGGLNGTCTSFTGVAVLIHGY